MCAMHRVAVALNKGHQSSFYEQEGKANPVFQAFEQELERFVASVSKRHASGYKPNAKEPASKLSDTLFNLWNNYQNRLPSTAWKRHMTEVGDYLVCMQEYGLAMWQCYDRLLMKSFMGLSQTHFQYAEQFRLAFFPGGFDDTVDTTFALRALMGRLICSFHLIRLADPHLSQPGSIEECLQLLSFLQSILQWLLPKESLCWLVFNGTVHIYTISRFLMSFGHSNKVTDYLLWACMCMESSVPLLSVKYLTWRATLYTAVCQCYYDCKSSQLAESFARRALGKINELSELERMSDQPPSKETEASFRTATIKMAIMVFKRTVVESRRRPKGVLRPKNRLNVKDVSQGPWPRTVTEKLLVSMFEGSSAQVLAVIEALTDSNRRTLMTSPPAPESDVEILDLYIELFMAAQEIITGGGGDCAKGAAQKGGIDMDGVVPEQSLMKLAIKGENGIPLSCVVKLIKAAYCYQQFEFFDMWLPKTLNALQELQDPKLLSCEVELKILQAFDKATGRSRNKKNVDLCPDDIGKPCNDDDLLRLATVLTSVLTTSFAPGVELDMDMVSDALIFLWNKCKAVLQRFQNSVTNNPKYLEKIDNCDKWMYILDKVYQVVAWCDLGKVDPVMVGEIALRLALLYEATSVQQMNASRHADTESQLDKTFNEVQLLSSGEPFNCSILKNIQKAKDVLYSGLRNLSLSRDCLSRSGTPVADVSWAKELNPEVKLTGDPFRSSPDIASDGISTRKKDSAKECLEAASNMAKDLQTEMLFHYHRLCIKNARLSVMIGVCKDENEKTKVPWTLKSFQATDLHHSWNVSFDKSCDDLLHDCHQDKLSRSLFSMQKALTFDSVGRSQDDKRKLLSEALNLLHQLEAEEKRLHIDSETSMEREPVESALPPPPVLIARTETSMTFKPPSYKPPDGQKVAWFRLFGHVISGSNVKARPNDTFLPGTGDEISVFDKEMRVTGLTGGEKYAFAIAAYSSDGELIGGSIGKSTKPILASHPSSLLSAWSFLAQISYQLACHNIALEAFQVLWDHIVAPSVEVENEWSVRSIEQEDPKLTVHRLNMKVIARSSPILLRSILSSLFVGVDVEMKERHLFCDVLIDRGPLTKGQMGRIRLCERLLLAVELAGWLNETNLALQLIVQCYGLLAPILYFKIASVPLVQVLERCLAVLQEIPTTVRQKYSPTTIDSLYHMTACMAYHLAKVLRFWGETNLASAFNDIGRKLLSLNYDPDKDRDPIIVSAKQEEECGKETVADEKRTVSPSSKRGSPTPRSPVGEKSSSREMKLEMKSSTQSTVAKSDTKNIELSALEAHLMQLSKQAQPKFELTGNEDQSILHGFIMYLPSALAYKQLKKFKGRSRYLEFLIQVIQKGLAEGNAEMAATWCEEAEQTFGINAGKPGGKKGMNRKNAEAGTRGKDEDFSYRAAVVEYSRGGQEKTTKMNPDEKVKQMETGREDKKKKETYKPLRSPTSGLPGSAKQRQQLETQARAKLKQHVTNVIRRIRQRQKQMRPVNAERPWRCQLNVLHGLCHFVALLNKLQSVNPLALDFVFRSSFLDLEWFHLENSRTLLDGPGAPVEDGVIEKKAEVPSSTPIEVAADAIANVVRKAEDNVTSRTNRSEFGGSPRQQKFARGKGAKVDEVLSVTKDEMAASVEKTCSYFTRAIVLAHRGRHWTLLQNVCKDFWNCLQMVLTAAKTPDKNGNDLLDDESVCKVAWKPLYFSADCLLDMLAQTQQQLMKSWHTGQEFTGQQADETVKGKADRLKMISSTDDVTSVDLHNVRRIAMRAVETLHFQEMWEKLIDIGLRFNALMSDRYSEAVSPVIAHAQHMLVARIIDNGGHPTLQPHFDEAVARNEGRPIRSTDYVTLQLKVQFNKNIMQQSVTSTDRNQRALQLSSVPLDVSHSLQNLKQVLDKSSHSSRSLENSRKLLALFLAGQHSVTSIEPSVLREKCRKSGIRLTEVPLDYDKGEHQFQTTADIRCHPICKADISLVITSYDKTVAALHLEGQMHLEAEALRELGNLQFYAGNLKAASKQWVACIDLLLGSANVIYSWRSHLKCSSDIPSQLLNRCGLWGCLIGGIVCSNIAQYILTSDVAVQTDCCLLAGSFFKGLLRSSLPHPVNDRSYAKYRIQQDSEVIDLIPGVDLLSDRFRCDGKTLVGALRYITCELALRQHNLFVLPLMALDQYFTTSVCRDVKRAVEGRILRARILTDLSLMEEAGLTLIELLYGDHLPQPFGSNSTLAEQRTGPDRFNTRLPITEENNLCVLELISEKRLSANLRTLYGPHLTCQLALTQAHFLVAVASVIPVLPKEDTMNLSESTPGKSTVKPEKSGKLLTVKASSAKQLMDTSNTDLSIVAKKRDVALDVVKARLLSAADQILTTLSSAIMDTTRSTDGNLSSDQPLAESEVELVVQVKLEQAAVAQQKHHSWMAARIIFSAMKMLQEADCLKEPDKKTNKKESLYARNKTVSVSETTGKTAIAKSEQFGYQNFLSRTHLNGRLWLSCRLSLVKSLLDQVRGLGQIPGVDQQVKVELADVDVYCRCGLEEAEKLGDIEAQAEFLFLGAMLHVVNGKPVQKTIHILQEVEQMLSQAKQLSTSGHLLLANVLIHKADLLTLAEMEGTKSAWLEKVDSYCDIQTLLLSQLEILGESVERRTDGQKQSSTLSGPIQNLYLPHLSLLVQTKLRIGHAMAQYAAEVAADITSCGMTSDLWVQSRSVLDNALQLSYVIITRIQGVEAELLLYKGQVKRQLHHLGKCEAISVCRTLMVAIKTAIASDHNLSLIRRAYLELALVYLIQTPLEVDTTYAASDLSLIEAKSSGSISSKETKQKKTTKERPEVQVAWAAISCASAVSKAQHDERVIARAESSLLQSVGSAAVAEMPGFIGMDLIGSKVVGEKKKIYKNEIEEELAPLSESLNPTQPESYESQLKLVKEAASKICWTRIVAYQTMLQRLCNASAVNTVEDKLNETDPKHLSNTRGKCSESQFLSEEETEVDLTSDHDVVKSLPFTASWMIRLHYVHKFLIKWVPSYAEQCSAIHPPKFLDSWSGVVNPEGSLPVTTYKANTIPDPLSMEQASASQMDSGNRAIKTSLVEPKVDQLCVQWYSPSLQHSASSGKKQVVPMYADFKKPKEFSVGIKVVGLAELLTLHKRLHILAKQDALSSEKASQKPQEQNALVIKQDEFHQVLLDIGQLLSYKEDRKQDSVSGKSLPVASSNKELENTRSSVSASSPSSVNNITSGGTQATDFPFERSAMNLQCLEKLFDPSLGLVIANKKMTKWLKSILC